MVCPHQFLGVTSGACGHLRLPRGVLLRWPQLPISPLEHLEKLEQLQLIEAGIRIDTLEVEGDLLSVDTPQQLEHARATGAGGSL